MHKESAVSFFEFKEKFKDEETCRNHLFKLRWPTGFVCPRCGSTRYSTIKTRNHYQCLSCRYQSSVTAGTVMDRTHLSLEKWFWAIYLVANDKRGYSATALHKQLGIGYKSAWYLLQRIRKAMMERDWDYVLSGIVELDDAFFGSANENGKRGRGTSKTPVLVGLSLNEKGNPKYIKMEVAENMKSDSITYFADLNIADGSTISTDAFRSYNQLQNEGYDHHPKIFNPKEDSGHLKWLHTIVSNAKAFINGTYHGLDKKHLPFYLSEFCYRFNRRFIPGRIFDKLLVSCVNAAKISYAELTT